MLIQPTEINAEEYRSPTGHVAVNRVLVTGKDEETGRSFELVLTLQDLVDILDDLPPGWIELDGAPLETEWLPGVDVISVGRAR